MRGTVEQAMRLACGPTRDLRAINLFHQLHFTSISCVFGPPCSTLRSIPFPYGLTRYCNLLFWPASVSVSSVPRLRLCLKSGPRRSQSVSYPFLIDLRLLASVCFLLSNDSLCDPPKLDSFLRATASWIIIPFYTSVSFS